MTLAELILTPYHLPIISGAMPQKNLYTIPPKSLLLRISVLT